MVLDALLGRRDVKGPRADRLFALSTAYVDLETAHGVKTRGSAGIVFQALATADFQQIVAETQELLQGTGQETGTQVETRDDEYGYKWVVLRDPDIEDLVVAINTVGDGLAVGGYGDRILAAVFAFEDAQQQRLYLIYNYKRGKRSRFVPAAGDKQRSKERDLHPTPQIGPALPMEPE